MQRKKSTLALLAILFYLDWIIEAFTSFSRAETENIMLSQLECRIDKTNSSFDNRKAQ